MAVANAVQNRILQSARTGARRGLFVLATGLWLGVCTAAAATFTATLDRSSITLGETAKLSLTFTGGEPDAVPTIPAVPDLRFAYAGRSSEFTIANGVMSSTVTHSYAVTPQKAGNFRIPPITARLNNSPATSQPLLLRVAPPGTPGPQAAASGSELALLRLVTPKATLYQGEVIVAELQLLVRQGVQGVDQFQLTGFPTEGLNAGKLVQNPQRQAQVGSALYSVISWSVPLTAIKTGTLTAGPVTASVVLEVPSRNRRRDPFFDQFGMRDPFDILGGGERRQVAVATEKVTLAARPLPTENVPSSFAGAIGSYSMNVSAGPTNVAVGDPITVKVEISGRGALDSLVLPEQSGWNQFKTYPPTSKVEPADSMGLQGTKTFEQVVVPERQDIKQLPRLAFSFFDPEAGQYRTLTRPPVPLVVRPGGAVAVPTIVTQSGVSSEQPGQARDIVHIKPRFGPVAQVQAPLVRQTWFLAMQTVPVLVFLTALIWRRRTESLANNPRLRRKRHVAQAVREGVAELQRQAAANDSDAFFATVFRLLQEQLGERLSQPASSITEAVIDEQLRPKGVAETVLEPLQELFQACNQARYAPVRSSQELSALVSRVESVLRNLRDLQI